jgi:hypothetical protein
MRSQRRPRGTKLRGKDNDEWRYQMHFDVPGATLLRDHSKSRALNAAITRITFDLYRCKQYVVADVNVDRTVTQRRCGAVHIYS